MRIFVLVFTFQNVVQISGMSHQLLEILNYMENDYEVVVVSNRESQFAGKIIPWKSCFSIGPLEMCCKCCST